MVIVIILIIGLCLGSFVNAFVWRLHEQIELSKKSSLTKADKVLKTKLSIVNGRSMCPHCQHELAVKDLVPIFSWLSLKGKCRYCHKAIPDSPLTEILTPLAFLASYLWWPVSIEGSQVAVFVLWLMLLVGFMTLVVYDLKWLTLPSRIIYSLWPIALAISGITIIAGPGHLKTLLDAVLGLLVGGGVFYVLFQVSNGKWIGGGDVRLGFLLGLLAASPGRSVLLIFLASLIGTIATLPFLALNKLKKSSIVPFGPSLIVGIIIVQLFGHSILSWYSSAFFPSGL